MPNSRQHTTARALRDYFPGSTLRVGPANITVQVDGRNRYVVQPIAIRKERRVSYETDSYRADKSGLAHDWVRRASYSHAEVLSGISAAIAKKVLTSNPESAEG